MLQDGGNQEQIGALLALLEIKPVTSLFFQYQAWFKRWEHSWRGCLSGTAQADLYVGWV
jgi:hypothetical protein